MFGSMRTITVVEPERGKGEDSAYKAMAAGKCFRKMVRPTGRVGEGSWRPGSSDSGRPGEPGRKHPEGNITQDGTSASCVVGVTQSTAGKVVA